MSNYFDLNSRMEKAYETNIKNNLEGFMLYSLRSEGASTPTQPAAHPNQMSFIEQIVMYLGIVLGVIFSSTVMNYSNNGVIDFTFSFGTMVIAFLVGLFIMPYVFEKVAFVGKPVLIQFSLFFQNGVLWQVIATAILTIR